MKKNIQEKLSNSSYINLGVEIVNLNLQNFELYWINS